MNKENSLEKAVSWVKNHKIQDSGIAVHNKTNIASQEVSGYLITSLYAAGESELAFELAAWEASVQQPNGAFKAPDGCEYTFDTAQVMRGFLTVLNDMPGIRDNLKIAAEYVASKIDSRGEIFTDSYGSWKLSDGSYFSRYCDLYTIWPLIQAGRILEETRYIEAGRRALDYLKKNKDLTEFKPELGTISHIFGYMMEALVDLGEFKLAEKGLKQVAQIQKADGSIPAFPGAKWICPPGIAQLGLAFYKSGQHERALRALAYLEKIQNPSGGWFASFGKGARYLPKKEVSWANKFFIDLYLLINGRIANGKAMELNSQRMVIGSSN